MLPCPLPGMQGRAVSCEPEGDVGGGRRWQSPALHGQAGLGTASRLRVAGVDRWRGSPGPGADCEAFLSGRAQAGCRALASLRAAAELAPSSQVPGVWSAQPSCPGSLVFH